MKYILTLMFCILATMPHMRLAHAGEPRGMSCETAVGFYSGGKYAAGTVVLAIEERFKADDAEWVGSGHKSYYERAKSMGFSGFVRTVIDDCKAEFSRSFDLNYVVDIAFFTYAYTGFNTFTFDLKQ